MNEHSLRYDLLEAIQNHCIRGRTCGSYNDAHALHLIPDSTSRCNPSLSPLAMTVGKVRRILCCMCEI